MLPSIATGFEACIPDQSKLDLCNGVHQEKDEYRCALFLQADAWDKNRSSTTYTPVGEIPTAGGYSRGGTSLTTKFGTFDGETHIYFDNPSWVNATITADAGAIYNATKSDKIVVIVGFGKTACAGGTFTVELGGGNGPSLVMFTAKEAYGPGEYAQTSGGLRPRDVLDSSYLVIASVLCREDLSDEERTVRLTQIEAVRGLMEANIHYRNKDCDHRSKNCPFPLLP